MLPTMHSKSKPQKKYHPKFFKKKKKKPSTKDKTNSQVNDLTHIKCLYIFLSCTIIFITLFDLDETVIVTSSYYTQTRSVYTHSSTYIVFIIYFQVLFDKRITKKLNLYQEESNLKLRSTFLGLKSTLLCQLK